MTTPTTIDLREGGALASTGAPQGSGLPPDASSRDRGRAPAASRRRPPSWRRTLAWILIVAGLSAVALVGFAVGVTRQAEERAQRLHFDTFRGQLALATAPVGGAIAVGRPVALLEAPQAGLEDVVVVEGTAPSVLVDGPGHRRDTPLPGQAGVSVVFGRAVTSGAPFAGITRLATGDRIVATTGQGRFTYEVVAVRRAGDPISAAPQEGRGRLVLVTAAAGEGLAASLAPGEAVYVDADLLDDPADGGPAAVTLTAAEAPFGTDDAAWLSLVLWLQALLLVVLLGAWGAPRWGRVPTWLLVAPVALALAWMAAETSMRLLPNLV